MRAREWIAAAALASFWGVCCCCSGGGGNTGGGSGGSTGSNGNNGGACGAAPTWTLVTLDATPDAGSPLDDLELAIGPGDVVGVGYLQDSLTQSAQGNELYDVRYVQYANGAAGQPQRIDQIQEIYGVSVAFQPSGVPAVAYLGGAPYGGDGGAGSHYWRASAAMVAYQDGGAGWTVGTADDGLTDPNGPTDMGTVASCTAPCNVSGGNCVCQSPYNAKLAAVVGLYSALGFDSKGVAYDYFRDVLFGQSIGTNSDFGSSRIDGEVGGAAGWTMEWAFLGTTWDYQGTPVLGLGGHLHLVMANDQPALVTDEFGQSPGAESGGQNVDFVMRLGTNNWSVPQRIFNASDTQTGPSLAYGAGVGFAAAVYDEGSSQQTLLFSSSQDGQSWSPANDVFAGSGGWYPSVAIDPTTGQPSIADFFCSDETGVSNLQSCPATQRSLELRTLQGAGWCSAVQVDPAGGYQPKLGFLSTGKRVIAYRQLDAKGKVGPLVLAVEQ
ncbi:MAG: hypothetical protein ACYDCL_00320 [Myxococcales bacterium]